MKRSEFRSEPIERPIRVTNVQPALAQYRVPVFREFARRPGIRLKVVYGSVKGVPNVAPDGFDATPTHRWEDKVTGFGLMIHTAEWSYCSPRHADVVVLRWSVRSIMLWPALLRARFLGVPVVLWGHGYSKTERWWWRIPRNWLAHLATAVLFYEPRTRDAFVRQGWNPDRLFVALNSLDHVEICQARDAWQENSVALPKFREENGIAEGPVILFVSRLMPANRIDLLIRATADLAREMPGLKTVVIGNGDEEKLRLEQLAFELGVADNVKFRDGIYDEFELAPWFLSSDVYCYPANIGLSLIHALWYGLPVVTSDNIDSQNPEIFALRDGVNGLLYQHENLSSLVTVLRAILADAERRTKMSEAARKTVEDRFTIPRMVDGLEAAVRYAARQGANRHR